MRCAALMPQLRCLPRCFRQMRMLMLLDAARYAWYTPPRQARYARSAHDAAAATMPARCWCFRAAERRCKECLCAMLRCLRERALMLRCRKMPIRAATVADDAACAARHDDCRHARRQRRAGARPLPMLPAPGHAIRSMSVMLMSWWCRRVCYAMPHAAAASGVAMMVDAAASASDDRAAMRAPARMLCSASASMHAKR